MGCVCQGGGRGMKPATLGRAGATQESLVGVGGLPSLKSQRRVSPQSALLAQNGTGSLPRNLAATLQDIEAKRQLALQQKGEWL